MVGHSCCHTLTHTHTHVAHTHTHYGGPATRASTIIIFLVETMGLTLGPWSRRDAGVTVGFDPNPAGARVCFFRSRCKPARRWPRPWSRLLYIGVSVAVLNGAGDYRCPVLPVTSLNFAI